MAQIDALGGEKRRKLDDKSESKKTEVRARTHTHTRNTHTRMPGL